MVVGGDWESYRYFRRGGGVNLVGEVFLLVDIVVGNFLVRELIKCGEY